jgi:hypothetical protein
MITVVENAPTSSGTSDDEARWAAAMSLLARTPTATARQRLRRFRLLVGSFIGGVLVLGAAAGVLVVLVLSDGPDADPDPSTGWVVTGLVVQALGLVALVGYLVLGWRAGFFRGAWSQPTAVLDRAQRRSLIAQVRGRSAVDERRLPLARHLAERFVVQRHQLVLLVGLALQQVGRAIGSPTAPNLWWTGGLLALYAVAVVFARRDARRAERFLREHPADESSAG